MKERSLKALSEKIDKVKAAINKNRHDKGTAISALKGAETDRKYLSSQIKAFNEKVSSLRGQRREMDRCIHKIQGDLSAASVEEMYLEEQLKELRQHEVELMKEIENG